MQSLTQKLALLNGRAKSYDAYGPEFDPSLKYFFLQLELGHTFSLFFFLSCIFVR